MKRLKIIFMGSPEFALPSIEMLAESEHTVLGIVTRPDRPQGRGYRTAPTPVKEWAASRGYYVYQPVRLTDTDFLTQMQVLAPDLIVNVAFGRIVPQKMLELPAHGSINLHPSLLPAYRGAAPVQHAIFNGEKHTGVTVLYMEEELDAGDIILQEEEPIPLSLNSGQLLERLAHKGARLLLKAIGLIAAGGVQSFPQDPGGISYAPPITTGEGLICWKNSALKIHNKVRGLAPSPGAYTLQGGNRLKIWKTEIMAREENGFMYVKPGTVISLGDDGIKVRTGDGIINIREIQAEGKKRMHSSDFWRGYRLKKGMIFG
ncbi:MAG: methionyl-tRNA formyltransferase [Firmicutes bacterium]|nr:methionyl-tRNA formyltransferase [Bacillota bacterium]